MRGNYRILILPALAVALPCAFIAVLATQWLALERDLAARRGAEAASAALDALRDGLGNELQTQANEAASRLANRQPHEPPLQAPPTPPEMFTVAYLFDHNGELVAPNPDRAIRRAIADYRSIADEANRRATALLDQARQSAAAGKYDDADRFAKELFACCAAVRDEYGVPLVMYAAWQRTLAYQRRANADQRLTELADNLNQLVTRGYLGHHTDVTGLTLLATRLGNRYGMDRVVSAAQQASVRLQQQEAEAQGVRRWLRNNETVADNGKAIVRVHDPASQRLVTIATVLGDHQLAALLDTRALNAWLTRWSAANLQFDAALNARDAPDRSAAVQRALFVETSAVHVALRERSTIADDGRRQRLFIAAVAGMLVVTLAMGYFAVRDLSREVRTASLRSAFIDGITHELKTPLASIRLLAETLKSGRARPDDASQLLDTIVEESDRLSRQVDDVLATSRIESGMRRYAPRSILVGEAVAAAIARFDYTLKKERFVLSHAIDTAELRVTVDPEALSQALLNLLGNALKYSGTAREIRVEVTRRDNHAAITVADRGIGIAPHQHARIFERFYRSPDAPPDTTGAGLGLALVQHFAEAHDGRVTVSSALGQGSAFTILLPLSDNSARDTVVDRQPIPKHG